MADSIRLRAVTSREVAQLAGVSRSTVSNILNGNDARFPEETRARVRNAAAQLRYTPSQAGRSLVSGRSSTVVLLLPATTLAPNLQDAIDDVVSQVDSLGGNVVIRFASATQESTVSSLIGMSPMAVLDLGVLRSDQLRQLEERGIIVTPSAQASDQASVSDGGIARIQAEALLQGGPRTVWFAPFADERRDPYSVTRLAALEEYVASRGLPLPRKVHVPLQLSGAVAALRTVLNNTEGLAPAVVCYNDDIALALLAAARELRVAVPAELAVVGVDNTPLGQLWSPRLTSVDTDVKWFVNLLAEDLRAQLKGTPLPVDIGPEGHFRLVPGETH